MELKPGYKQTDVGVIPEEWDVRRLGDLARVHDGTHQTPRYVPVGIPFYSVEQVTGGDFSQTKFISEEEHRLLTRSYKIERGDILMTRIGSIGDCRLVDWDVNASFYVSLALLKLHGADSAFIAQYSKSQGFKAEVELHSLPSATPKKINLGPISDIRIPLPPRNEQRAIAEALSDVDALLSGLDRLIAKKRDLKQAAMQQLLTGQTRLPGFRGEWEETTFSELVRHHSGNSALIKGKLSQTNAAGLFAAYSASGQDVWHAQYEHEGEAIVVSAVGSRCGKAFKATGKWSAIANTHVVWPVVAKVDIRFLTHFLDDEKFWQKSGTGQPFVLFPKSFSQSLRLPSLEEQTAIATILSDMDAELAALEARRDKTRAIKQGMMQELLTGRTRLV